MNEAELREKMGLDPPEWEDRGHGHDITAWCCVGAGRFAFAWPARQLEAIERGDVQAVDLKSAWDSLRRRGSLTLLLGPTGAGKTFAMSLLACLVAQHDYWKPRYKRAADLLEWRPIDRDHPDPLGEAKSWPVLFLDDIQLRPRTESGDRRWNDLVIARYDRPELRTVLATDETDPNKLRALLGERIVGRLRETGGIVKLEGSKR